MKIRNIFNRLSKKAKVAYGALAALAIVAVPAAVMAGYGPNGPDRVIFDWSKPEQRVGALDAPRFNSFINTNVYGDERAFVDAKECTVNGAECYKKGVAGGYLDQQPVVAGKEYIVRAYIHNNANQSLNDDSSTTAPLDGKGVAKKTRIRFELPNTDGLANGFTAQARIFAENSIPKEVYDTVDLRNNNKKFNVSYVTDSAYIFNNSHPNGLKLSDNIMGADGTLIGDKDMNGVYPGCFEFTAFVVIRVKVTAPEIDVQKYVSTVEMPKMTDVSESIHVKNGDTVNWRINYKNTGTHFAKDVTIRDQLPAGLSIVPGSIKLTTALGTETLQDTALGSGGVNVGTYAVNGNGVIRFGTVVNANEGVCELTNVALGRAADVAEKSDTAKIVIDDCQPPVVIKRCVLGEITYIDRTKRDINVSAEVQNATVTKYITTVKNKSGEVVAVEEKVTNSTSYVYNFNQPTGEYAVSVRVVTDKGDAQGNCVTNIIVEEEQEDPVYSCDSMAVTLVKDWTFRFNVSTTAENGASVVSYHYNFGDNSDVLMTDKGTVDHSYKKAGKYIPKVSVTFNVNGENVTVDGSNCSKTITIDEKIEYCEVKGKGHLPKDDPKCKEPELPDTGAGSIAGILAGVTVAGSFAHRKHTLRRR